MAKEEVTMAETGYAGRSVLVFGTAPKLSACGTTPKVSVGGAASPMVPAPSDRGA